MSASPAAVAGRERPILFAGRLVRAILAGTKTQTRRVILQPRRRDGAQLLPEILRAEGVGAASPYGVPGDRLWVRETWQCFVTGKNDLLAPKPRPTICSIGYAATEDARVGPAPDFARFHGPWRPSIFMPRWASRLTLEVIGIRVERLQEISYDDMRAEGLLAQQRLRRRTRGAPEHLLRAGLGLHQRQARALDEQSVGVGDLVSQGGMKRAAWLLVLVGAGLVALLVRGRKS